MTEETKEEWNAGLWAFLRNLAAILVAMGVIWKGILPLAAPAIRQEADAYLQPMVDMIAANAEAIESQRIRLDAMSGDAETIAETRRTLAQIAETQRVMAATLNSAVERLAAIEAEPRRNGADVVEIHTSGSSISDGSIGGIVLITWAYTLRRNDCGRPQVTVFFRNGGNRVHRFEDVSAIDETGRGVGDLGSTGQRRSISYTARIPQDDGVIPGRATGWTVSNWPDCPSVRPYTSPEIPFLLLRPEGVQ